MNEVIKKVKRVPISQNVTKQLIDLIMSGELATGEKLPSERELMDYFDIGRSSLREAIKAVEVLGLIEVRVPEGTFVTDNLGEFFTKHLALMSKVGLHNIEELIEARLTIETQIAGIAAEKATKKDIDKLEMIINQMKQAVDNNDAFQEWDLTFHRTLAEMARNSFLIQVMKILQEITSLWISKTIRMENIKEIAIRQHEEILTAIQANDVQKTKEEIRYHLRFVSDLLIKIDEKEQTSELNKKLKD